MEPAALSALMEGYMKILVIGSAGTIGAPLVRALRSRGHVVYESDLQHSHHDYYMRCDVSNARQVSALFERYKPDMVYMLAAEFGRHNGEAFYEQCWATNVIGGRHVMEHCSTHGVKLVFMSSSEAYGEAPQPLMVESDTEHFPLRHHNDYAMSKWVNEQQIMNMEREAGLACVRVRFFNAYGPGEHYHEYRSVVCLFCYRALKGEPYTVYQNYHRVFMYIDDAVRTLANIAEAFKAGRVYNIGGEEYRSIEDVDSILRLRLGSSFSSEVRVLPKDGHNTVDKRPSIEAARKDLGHELTVNLEEGIDRTIDWLRKTYQL